MRTPIGINTIRYTAAEQTARRVLAACGLDDPTDVTMKQVILGRGVFYEEKPLTAKEGETVSCGSRSIIAINSNIAFPEKKRFAAAHELGHFEMHRDLTPLFFDTEYDLVNWYQTGHHEVEANEFAAEFLMPSELFRKESTTGKKFDPSIIEHLAKRFQVSKTTAILQFAKRGTHPVCVVCCRDNKMKWFKPSPDFRYFIEFVFNQHPPAGSVAYEMFTSGKIYTGEERKQPIWKSDWFRMSETEYKDTRFYEYCLYAKSYNFTISMIWED